MERRASGFSSFCLWFVIIAQITMPHHPNTTTPKFLSLATARMS